ncbi:uncharacterized protein LOC131226630 [Magnolia sinica]|uniref:uncharacterized protein LOC131226630 n=1 Tax=Magnolia sinica TaxID=86752 RepID=UPI002659DA13|nr:uncharacterized protein LOC131226630 [Magnolia sinica]
MTGLRGLFIPHLEGLVIDGGRNPNLTCTGIVAISEADFRCGVVGDSFLELDSKRKYNNRRSHSIPKSNHSILKGEVYEMDSDDEEEMAETVVVLVVAACVAAVGEYYHHYMLR